MGASHCIVFPSVFDDKKMTGAIGIKIQFQQWPQRHSNLDCSYVGNNMDFFFNGPIQNRLNCEAAKKKTAVLIRYYDY